MILAFHSIITAYGFWLPNEPRGSWSTYVGSWELARFGPATKVDTHRSVAQRPYNRELKQHMQDALNHPPVHFTGEQAVVIESGLADTPYTLHALAILPEHVHMVIAHTERDIRLAVGHLKAQATRALRAAGWFVEQQIWTDHGWNVYLDSDADVERAVEYVQGNPLREGKRAQHWSCVVGYDAQTSRAATRRASGGAK